MIWHKSAAALHFIILSFTLFKCHQKAGNTVVESHRFISDWQHLYDLQPGTQQYDIWASHPENVHRVNMFYHISSVAAQNSC